MINICNPTNHGLIESNENLVNFCQTCSWDEFEKAGNFQTFALIIKTIKWKFLCGLTFQIDVCLSICSFSIPFVLLHTFTFPKGLRIIPKLHGFFFPPSSLPFSRASVVVVNRDQTMDRIFSKKWSERCTEKVSITLCSNVN